MARISILGVPVDALTKAEALGQLHAFLGSNEKHHVMTPNNEMLVEAQKNAAFHLVLNASSLNLADSTGLLWAARMTHQHLPERVTGVDTVEALCRNLDGSHPVFFLGAAEGVAQKAAEELKKLNPNLVVAGTFAGSAKDEEAAEIIGRINDSGAHLLLVAFGAPKQDLWIAKHLHELSRVKVAMGIGGTFDFLAGVQKRAPTMIRSLGLEWLWRLILQPRRLPRIIRATLVFPWFVLRSARHRAMPQ